MRPIGTMFAMGLLGLGLAGGAAGQPAATAPSPGAAPSVPVLLEKAIYTEETIGDIDAAIKIYQAVVEQAKANRRYAAQAQYRMAMCCLKKGDKAAAVRELRGLLAAYPQETDVAEQARRELAKLGPVAGPASGAGKTAPRLPAEVMAYIVNMHTQAYRTAQEKNRHVNAHVYRVDGEFSLSSGGLLTWRNQTAQAVPGPIHLANFGTEQPDFVLTDEQGRDQNYDLRERLDARAGKWAMWWKPDQPVQPGALRLLGYLRRGTWELPKKDGIARLAMQNRFGPAVQESFYLVVPAGMGVVGPASKEFESRKQVGQFDVYLWRQDVPAGTTNTVEVTLKAPATPPAPPATAPKALSPRAEPAPSPR